MAEPTKPTRAAAANPLQVRFDRFELDEANAKLLRDGESVDLPPMPFAVLCALAREPGALRTKNALLDEVWGHRFVGESVLKTVIRNLRIALQDDARQPRIIETVSRRGYRFIAPVAPLATAAAPGPVPLPVPAPAAADPARPSPSLVGREDALGHLRTSWSLATGGKRIIVWVAGEPGIGKTTLIEHFVAGLSSALCIRGQCVEQRGAGEPYLPVLEALGELCRRDPEAPGLLNRVAPAWFVQLPWLSTAQERELLRRELSGTSADRMLREMGEFLDRYSERHPLLLVTEDLHWSDRSTIQLIDHAARRRGSARFMWLASYRLAEVVALDHPLNALRRELRLHGLCEEIVLDPFSEREVAQYVTRLSPTLAGDEAFVRALHKRTDGLPLFIEHAVKEILVRPAAEGDDKPAAERLARVAVPDSIVAMIEHHYARLPLEHRALLTAAAVCGMEFRASTVAEVLGRDAIEAGLACDAIAADQLWLADPLPEAADGGGEPAYRFRHALLRQVLYERTGRALRMQLHAKAGATRERERRAGFPVTAAELAAHFERGGEALAALGYYVEAAESSLLRFSPAECMTLTAQAAALVERAPKGLPREALEFSLSALRGVAAAHLQGMGASEAKSAFERAYALLESVGSHRMQGLVLHGLGILHSMRGEYPEALAVARRAEALAASNPEPILAVASSTIYAQVDMLQGRPREARTRIEPVLALEAFEGASELSFIADPRVTLLGILALQLLHLGLAGEARRRLDEAHERARALAQPFTKVVALWLDGLCEVRRGNAERVAALADEMQRLVDEFALPTGRTAGRWLRGWAQARMGDPQGAVRILRAANEEAAHAGVVAGASENLGYAAEALMLARDFAAAQEQLGQAFAIAHTYGERIYLPQLFILQASLARAQGNTKAAEAALREGLAEAESQGARWLELLVRIELGEHGGLRGAERRALAALMAELRGADGAPAVERASALLG
jgi:DNA-binding winged helix-turn-helix (wHTH) protein/tetratricopeptide (TPR) repeat protein